MLPFKLTEIDSEKLQQICDDRTSESLTLEFKRELPGRDADHKAEFLKDVSALANADGGDLVYGIEERQGAAFRLHPIDASTSGDAEKRRLGQILDSSIEPRITGIQYHWTQVGDGFVLILRIPKSYDAPHRLALASHRHDEKFYLRSGTHISTMSYDQLKASFDRTATLTERVKVFRLDRLQAIRQGQTPKPMLNGPCCVAHLIPLASASMRQVLDVVELRNAGINEILFYDWGHNSAALNLDGVVAHSHISPASPQTYGYNQIYRTGCTESVFHAASEIRPQDMIIPSTVVTAGLRLAVERNISLLRNRGVSGPVIVALSMLNVTGYTFGVGGMYSMVNTALADRSDLILPEVWVESLDGLTSVDDVVKPLLDLLWQSFGVERCLEYTTNGDWQPRRG